MLKRIKTKQQIEKEKKRNQIIIGTVLVSLLLLSTIGYSFFSRDSSSVGGETTKEKGIIFSNINNYWRAKIGGIDFNFQFLPSQVEDISVETTMSLDDYAGEVVYFVNPGSVASEALNNLNAYILRYQEACLEGEFCVREGLPIKNCEDKLIIYKESSETKVTQESNCVFIEGEGIKATDAFLYKILDIN